MKKLLLLAVVFLSMTAMSMAQGHRPPVHHKGHVVHHRHAVHHHHAAHHPAHPTPHH